jgi:hypothetical protein
MRQSVDRSHNPKARAEKPPPVTPELIARLEEALGSVGAFGEVRLVVLKGRVRFIETVRSESLEGYSQAREQLE